MDMSRIIYVREKFNWRAVKMDYWVKTLLIGDWICHDEGTLTRPAWRLHQKWHCLWDWDHNLSRNQEPEKRTLAEWDFQIDIEPNQSTLSVSSGWTHDIFPLFETIVCSHRHDISSIPATHRVWCPAPPNESLFVVLWLRFLRNLDICAFRFCLYLSGFFDYILSDVIHLLMCLKTLATMHCINKTAFQFVWVSNRASLLIEYGMLHSSGHMAGTINPMWNLERQSVAMQSWSLPNTDRGATPFGCEVSKT